jgi:hypothetical protein
MHRVSRPYDSRLPIVTSETLFDPLYCPYGELRDNRLTFLTPSCCCTAAGLVCEQSVLGLQLLGSCHGDI